MNKFLHSKVRLELTKNGNRDTEISAHKWRIIIRQLTFLKE